MTKVIAFLAGRFALLEFRAVRRTRRLAGAPELAAGVKFCRFGELC